MSNISNFIKHENKVITYSPLQKKTLHRQHLRVLCRNFIILEVGFEMKLKEGNDPVAQKWARRF